MVLTWDFFLSAAPLLNFTNLVIGSFTFSAMPLFCSLKASFRLDDEYLKFHTSLRLTVRPFFSLLNTFIMFPLTGDWKNRAAASWNAGILAVKWQHLVCTWVQTPTSGVWKQEIESKWAAAVCFCFCGPQVFHYTAKTWAAGHFDTVDVVNLCGKSLYMATPSLFKSKLINAL